MSTSTTLPRSSAAVSGGELSHSPPPSNEGRTPSTESEIEDVTIGFMGCLHSVDVLVAAMTGLASMMASNSRSSFHDTPVAARGSRGVATQRPERGAKLSREKLWLLRRGRRTGQRHDRNQHGRGLDLPASMDMVDSSVRALS